MEALRVLQIPREEMFERPDESCSSVKCSWLWDLHFAFGPNFSPSKVSSDHCISVQSKHVTFDLFLLEMLLFSASQLLLI